MGIARSSSSPPSGTKALFADNRLTLILAVAFFLYGVAFDLSTTLYCERFVAGCHEASPLLTDAFGKYLPLKYLWMNGVGVLAYWAPFAALLGLAFRCYAIASLPFWYLGAIFGEQGVRNLFLILLSR